MSTKMRPPMAGKKPDKWATDNSPKKVKPCKDCGKETSTVFLTEGRCPDCC